MVPLSLAQVGVPLQTHYTLHFSHKVDGKRWRCTVVCMIKCAVVDNIRWALYYASSLSCRRIKMILRALPIRLFAST